MTTLQQIKQGQVVRTLNLGHVPNIKAETYCNELANATYDMMTETIQCNSLLTFNLVAKLLREEF